MPYSTVNNNANIAEINLLSSFKGTQKWIPCVFRRQNRWKVLSGKWKFVSPNKAVYYSDPKKKTAENISIIGSSDWNALVLKVRFKILTDSIKPPEGGVILYPLFKNTNNFYSFHLCLSKQRVEFIKRFRNIWSIMAQQSCALKKHKDYLITVCTNSGNYYFEIDENNTLMIQDTDISKGCVGIEIKYCDVAFSHVSVSIPSNDL